MKHKPLASGMPDTEALAKQWEAVHREIKAGNIRAAYALGFGGLAEALVKMSLGNEIGVDVSYDKDRMFDTMPGSIVVEAAEPIDVPGVEFIGYTIEER